MRVLGTIEEPSWALSHKGKSPKPIQFQVGSNGCWNCISHSPRPQHGHPVTRRRKIGHQMLLSRYIYLILQGDIPEYLQVNHTCHNNLCINPEHLYLGTQTDNVYDSRETNKPVGTIPLDDLTVGETERLLDDGIYTQQEIADVFFIHRKTVSRINCRRVTSSL